MCSCFISIWGLGSAGSFFKEENYLPLSLLFLSNLGIPQRSKQTRCQMTCWLSLWWRREGTGAFVSVGRVWQSCPASSLRFTRHGEYPVPLRPPSILLSSTSPWNPHTQFPFPTCPSPPHSPWLGWFPGSFSWPCSYQCPGSLPNPCVFIPISPLLLFLFSPCWDRVSCRLGWPWAPNLPSSVSLGLVL